MYCTSCNFVSPITGKELVKGEKMELTEVNVKGIYIYKKYICTKCNVIKEVIK